MYFSPADSAATQWGDNAGYSDSRIRKADPPRPAARGNTAAVNSASPSTHRLDDLVFTLQAVSQAFTQVGKVDRKEFHTVIH